MADILQDTPLGPLSIVEIYEYYDGPRLFSCRSEYGQLFLAFWADVSSETEHWYLIPVSRKRLRQLERGEIDLRNAIQKVEGGFVWKIGIGEGTTIEAAAVRAQTLDVDTLPDESERLKAQPYDLELPVRFKRPIAAQSPATYLVNQQRLLWTGFSPEHLRREIGEWSRQRAVDEQRDVFNLMLEPIEGGHEIAAAALGPSLLRVQQAVDAINQALPSYVRNSALNVSFSFPSSFGVQLVSDYRTTAANRSAIGEAIRRFVQLVESGDNEADLRAQLEDLRVRAARRYRDFLRVLTDSKCGLAIEWASPTRDYAVATMPRARVYTVLTLLNRIERDMPSDYPVTGRLVAVHLRLKTFELWDESVPRPKRYAGHIAESAIDDVGHAIVGATYFAIIRETFETPSAFTDRKPRYELISLRRVGTE